MDINIGTSIFLVFGGYINNTLKMEYRMPRMALVVVVLNLLLCVILCDKKEFIINYEDYEEKIVVFVYAY
ncbi:hypothetical protein [Bacteroides thetaiotaomicron]|uniref:hypothetical protein n=1 Tax=Bacteroides thetaiotaomicron TaxID=818 RepID=UPI001F348D9A|nr:hypothetical protein [Bacteroides thetaiotaomicron]